MQLDAKLLKEIITQALRRNCSRNTRQFHGNAFELNARGRLSIFCKTDSVCSLCEPLIWRFDFRGFHGAAAQNGDLFKDTALLLPI